MRESNADEPSMQTNALSVTPDKAKGSVDVFGICSAVIRSLAGKGASFEIMMTYIMLARGVGTRSHRRVSAYGQAHVVSKTSIDPGKIATALRWLAEQHVIVMSQGDSGSERTAKWQLLEEQVDTYLPTILTDNRRQPPPVMRLYAPSQTQHDAQDFLVDDLVVLVHLYLHQDMQRCGGVNPRSGLYRHWCGMTASHGAQIMNIIGSDAALYEAGGRTEIVYGAFADMTLPHIDTAEREERFYHALSNLLSMGMVYEVLQIWEANPVQESAHEARPLYTVYIHDQQARELDPSLQKEIQRVVYRLGMTDGYDEFSEADYANAMSVKFRYVADKQVGGYPLGSYRLKYRPKEDEARVSIDAESGRANAWLAQWRRLYLQQP